MSISEKMTIKHNLLSVPGLRKFDPGTDKNKRWCVYFLLKANRIVHMGVSRSLKSRVKNFRSGNIKMRIPHDEVYFLPMSEFKVHTALVRFKIWHKAAQSDRYLTPGDFNVLDL